MKYLILLSLCSMPLWADSKPLMTEEVKPNNFKIAKNHWLFGLNIEGLGYETPFRFSGDKKKISPKTHGLYGGRVSAGREYYLGGGFTTVTRGGGFFLGKLFDKVTNAKPEYNDLEFGYVKTSGQIWGVEASQSIGRIFEYKSKNIFTGDASMVYFEPYVEGGVGWARAINRVNYHYDTTGATAGGVLEDYKLSVSDQLTSVKLAVGINVTSHEGYFFNLNVSQTRYDITERKTKGYTQSSVVPFQRLDGTDNNATLKPILVYSLGGGYKF